MNKKIKRMWLRALRSGKFKQGRGALRVDETQGGGGKGETTYCCLGVLCELYRRSTKKGSWNEWGFVAKVGDFNESWLPETVTQWAGLESIEHGENPRVLVSSKDKHRLSALSDLNDSGRGFKRIATCIERTL